MEEVPKHLILTRALETIDRNEVTAEWKREHFNIILFAEAGFKNPEHANPDITNSQFREGVRRTKILSQHLAWQIRHTNTFDTEVFRIMCTQILECLQLAVDEDWLCETMQSVTL
jgi:hypothetical protein